MVFQLFTCQCDRYWSLHINIHIYLVIKCCSSFLHVHFLLVFVATVVVIVVVNVVVVVLCGFFSLFATATTYGTTKYIKYICTYNKTVQKINTYIQKKNHKKI